MQTRELLSSAWYGDLPITLSFPDGWQVQVVGDQPLPPLSVEAICQGIQSPLSGPSLRQIAKGHHRTAILIDDLTRPTPVGDILPPLLAELEAGGIQTNQVTLVVAGGTHPPADEHALLKKLGGERYPWHEVVFHDCQRDLSYLGTTSRGTPVYINSQVLACDLRIGVGCIYPHPAAGFSGGAKALVPGVAGAETIRYMHDHLRGARGRGEDLDNEFRLEAEDTARRIGLHFIVNAALNQQRQISAVFAGDFIHAFRAGVDHAHRCYSVEGCLDTDITIADMYPFDADLQFAYDRGMWPLYAAPKRSLRVLLAACPAGLGSHTLFPVQRSLQARLSRRLKHFRLRDLNTLPYRLGSAYRLLAHRSLPVIMVSPGLSQDQARSVFPAGKLYPDWRTALTELEQLIAQPQRAQPSVAIYRCAPLMIPRGEGLRS